MKRAILVTALVPLLLTACGDDGDSSSEDDETSATDGLSAEEAEVHEALVASFFDPSCELLTEEYLLEKALLSETPEEACEEHERSWIEPQYSEDDVLVSDIEINGDVATAVVGSEYVNIETTYELRLVDGTWKVSCDDFTCDHLEEPSAEVS